MPPEAGEVELGEYGEQWIAERKLAPRTRELYEDHFRLHIRPHLGKLMLGAIKPATIRTWRKRLLDGGGTEPQAVKAYCLLRAILNTAVKDDGIIRENPCRIRGYDRYHTPERPVATVEQVYRLADEMPPRFRALVIVAALSGLRWGELAALRRADVDLAEGVIRVAAAVAALRLHLLQLVDADQDALVFVGDQGGLLRTGNFRRAVKWAETVRKAGLPVGFHFHDLRHTGNNLAAAAGASTRELMHRMGHASMRAALIYQHATSERDREIADGMDERIARGQGKKVPPKKSPTKKVARPRRPRKGDDPDDGTGGVVARVG